MGGLPWKKRGVFDFYRLDSFLTIVPDEQPSRYRDFILDSGIFSYLNGKNTDNVDWEKYVDDYAKFVLEKRIKNYVEVDVDKIVGLSEVERLRKRLEARVGWKSMPVWHINRGYDKWLEICRDYDYVCFGAFITDGLSKSKYLMVPKFISDAARLGAKVHGLGFTDFKWMPKLHFYSVDSSSWVSGNRYGHVFKYNNGKVDIIKRPPNHKMTNLEELAWHNFTEWMLFSNYAESHL